MKLALEVIISLIFHPVAVVLAWINLARRQDMDGTKKLLWGIVVLVWGIGPILYMILEDGSLW